MYDNENGQGYGSPDNSNQWNQPNDGRAGINQPNQQQYYAPQTSRTYYSGENYSPFPNEGPLPTGPAYPNGPYQPNPPYNQGNDSSSRNSGLAVACLVLGILGFLSGVFFVGIALDVLAIILGIVSLIQNNRKKGLPIAGMVLAFLSIILTFLVYYTIGISQDRSVRGVEREVYVPTTEEKATSSMLMPNITQTDYAAPKSLILVYENKNAVDVQLEITVTYYDENDDLLFLRNSYIWGCAAGGRAAVDVPYPYDKDYNDIPYSRYEITALAKEVDYRFYSQNYGTQFQIKSNPGSRGSVLASITNPTGMTFDSVELMCIYYKDGSAIGITSQYISDMEKKANVEFSAPYDSDYNDLEYDDYEIIINGTNNYNS